MTQLGTPDFEIAYKKIFKVNVFEMNENFFECFLNSLNRKFRLLIKQQQDSDPSFVYSFDSIIHIISVILQRLIERVFLAETPEQGSQNFRDKVGRYTPERLALRVLEIRIFKDIPLSDNNWTDYYLSRNKMYIKKLFREYFDIPDSYFFSPQRLLKINMIYDRTILNSTPYLEEWLILKLYKSFYDFLREIESRLKEGYSKLELREALKEFFTRGIINQNMRENLEEFAEFFASLWVK
jgi:hypothetical protein